MKKIPSLFKRDYKGTRQVFNEVVPGSEWVLTGEGVATEKYDGTCCMVLGDKLYKRYDRKMVKRYYNRLKNDSAFIPNPKHFKAEPPGWQAAELEPNLHTGHWPGWLPVKNVPEDQWHREAFEIWEHGGLPDGTYELIGPKIQNNPYNTISHRLYPHGQRVFSQQPPRDFDGLLEWLLKWPIEGIVWHHLDGRMVKIKRSDFGLRWPLKDDNESMKSQG